MRGPMKQKFGGVSQQGEEQSGTQTSGDEQPGGHGPRGGHKKPKLEDVTQEVVTNADGSVDVTLTGTDKDGETRTSVVSIADNSEGGVSIVSTKDDGKSRTVAVSEDAKDGGVDVAITHENAEGETVTKLIELDMNDDGTISFEMLFTDKDGEEQTVQRDLELERFLGEADEELTVAEVVEAFLDRGPVDASGIDLTGLNNLDNGTADLLVV